MGTLGRRIDFAAGEMCEASEVSANLVYFVCFASQNAILSQPAADSPFQKGPCPCGGRGLTPIQRLEP